MNDQSGVKVQASRITFDLRQVFPSEDPISIPLLRLMAATDDARHIQKLALIALDDAKSTSELEGPILNGELLHLFRLLCGHLYEAGMAFRVLEDAAPELLDKAACCEHDGKTYLDRLRIAYAKSPPGAYHYSFLKPIRDSISFHYLDEPLSKALRKHNDAGDLEG